MGTMEKRLKLLFTCLALMFLGGCSPESESPEQSVRNWLAAAEAAAEARDRTALMDMVSEAYGDPRGNERPDINNLLRVYFLRQQDILLSVHINEIVIHADTAASVTVTVGMLGVRGRLDALAADAYRFEFEIERDGDDWLLLAARWSPLGEPLL